MANNKLLTNEKQANIGNFLVGRLLPIKEKRQVGPFTFIDHMGPAEIGPNKYMDVDQHPHIGLSTLTYLFEGEIEHKDSIGSEVIVKKGDVGFMTAGSGVSHTERTPKALRDGKTYPVHGYQIWVALPKELEEMNPEFHFVQNHELPSKETEELKIIVAAGEGFGMKSPLKVHSPLFMVDVLARKDTELNIRNKVEGEIAFVIVKGRLTNEGQEIEAGQMLISTTENECKVQLKQGTQLLLFGGEPLPEQRFLSWNFVSSNKDRLKQAQKDWEEKKFPKVASDNTYIPFPTWK